MNLDKSDQMPELYTTEEDWRSAYSAYCGAFASFLSSQLKQILAAEDDEVLSMDLVPQFFDLNHLTDSAKVIGIRKAARHVLSVKYEQMPQSRATIRSRESQDFI